MPPSRSETAVQWVTEDTIRRRFNDSQLWEQVKSGRLVTHTTRSSHLDSPPCGEPVCTHSQIVYYYAQHGDLVAVVHQYLRPDGTLGGSGRPDPKRLVLQDRIIAVRSRRGHR